MNNVTLVCFAVVFIGVGLSVASLATPYWIQLNFSFNVVCAFAVASVVLSLPSFFAGCQL